jgi:hypothetical protein
LSVQTTVLRRFGCSGACAAASSRAAFLQMMDEIARTRKRGVNENQT